MGATSSFLVLVIACILSAESNGEAQQLDFPAIFNFGDSNSDTGSFSAAFYQIPPPNGETFFGQPSGRFCDGRVIIDFLAERLGLPYLRPYLDSLGSSFRHGANFAVGGATIGRATGEAIDAGFSPISRSIQLSQFRQFKNRTVERRGKGDEKDDNPRPEDFSKALYTIDIGQNDLHFKLITVPLTEVYDHIPPLIHQISSVIQTLYEQGARNFWVHNTGPLGCLPIFRVNGPPHPNNTDEIGCVKSHNEVAQEFNNQLRDLIHSLRDKYPYIEMLAYVNIYYHKYVLYKNAESIGFVDPFGYCCKHSEEEPDVKCWEVKKVNGTDFYATSCRKPGEYISWDSVHYTQAANEWVINRIWAPNNVINSF